MPTTRARDALAVLGARGAGRLARLAGYSASSLPGLVAERLSPGIAGRLAADLGPIALVSGTNGKTTTSLALATILRGSGRRVAANPSGANLGQAVVTALVARSGADGRLGRRDRGADAVFEVDEAALPALVGQLPVRALLLTNLFRDQLDRFGETDRIVRLWSALLAAHPAIPVVYCADEPRLAALVRGRPATVAYGFAEPPTRASAADASGAVTADVTTCPVCAAPLATAWTTIGHLGSYRCGGCGFGRPALDLAIRVAEDRGFDGQRLATGWGDVDVRLVGPGNAYNVAAAIAAAVTLGVDREAAVGAAAGLSGPFGRWETLELEGRRVVLALVKNPASLDEVTRAGTAASVDGVLFAMNDQHADGRDVSWYWDADPTPLVPGRRLAIAGARGPDLVLRLRYELSDDPADPLPGLVGLHERPIDGLDALAGAVPRGGTVLVVSTYTALLGLRAALVARGLLPPMPV
ncbi:MAG: hypothetical protein RL338_334 [Chloroflexota bacterium]